MPRLNEAESKSIELPNGNGKAKTQPKSDRLSRVRNSLNSPSKPQKGRSFPSIQSKC